MKRVAKSASAKMVRNVNAKAKIAIANIKKKPKRKKKSSIANSISLRIKKAPDDHRHPGLLIL
jgi:hypothetical protein